MTLWLLAGWLLLWFCFPIYLGCLLFQPSGAEIEIEEEIIIIKMERKKRKKNSWLQSRHKLLPRYD